MVDERTKQEKRWVSRGLVTILIREQKDYKAAAEIESGSSDVFAMCERDIVDKVTEVEKDKSVAAGLALQQVLDNARAEVEEHERWQNQVFERLPQEDDEQGLTGPLRLSFTKSAAAREKLSQVVEKTYEQYFSTKSI